MNIAVVDNTVSIKVHLSKHFTDQRLWFYHIFNHSFLAALLGPNYGVRWTFRRWFPFLASTCWIILVSIVEKGRLCLEMVGLFFITVFLDLKWRVHRYFHDMRHIPFWWGVMVFNQVRVNFDVVDQILELSSHKNFLGPHFVTLLLWTILYHALSGEVSLNSLFVLIPSLQVVLVIHKSSVLNCFFQLHWESYVSGWRLLGLVLLSLPLLWKHSSSMVLSSF